MNDLVPSKRLTPDLGDRDATMRAGATPSDSPAQYARRALAALRRRWLSAAAVFLFVMGLAAYHIATQPFVYTATANLVVNARVLNVVSPDTAVVPVAPPGDAAVNTEVEILQSDEVARRVAEALDAGVLPGYTATLTHRPPAQARDLVAGLLRSHLAIRRPGATNVVGVSYSATDPAVAAIVANEFARQYLFVKGYTRETAARAADKELFQQLEAMRGQVEGAEQAVAAYKAANNLLSADGSTLTEQEVSLYRQQAATSETTLAADRARLNTARSQLRAGSKGDDIGEALGSPVITALRQQRSQLSADLAQLLSKYKPGYPDVVKVQRQLADVDDAIQQEIGRDLSNLEAQVSVSQQRSDTARSIVAGATGQLAANTAASVRLNELQRRADATKSTYAALLARRNDVASEASVGTDDARIFSPATAPQRPISPNRRLELAIAGMLALLLSALTVWLLQVFDRGLVTSQDAERALSLRHIANLPSTKSIARRGERGIVPIDFVLQRPLSMIAEACRNILLAADRATGAGRGIIAVTSSRPEEGKTTLAISLARTSAAAGRSTLLIDADFRRPNVATMLSLRPTAGVLDVLSGAKRIEEVLLRDEASGAWVLPGLGQTAGQQLFPSADLIEDLFAKLENGFDAVIVDTAPVLAAIESRIVLHSVDAVIFAVRWKKTLVPFARAALRRLADAGIVPIGVVLTLADMRAIGRYGSGDVDHGYRAYENYGFR